jgi:hypothetical protein
MRLRSFLLIVPFSLIPALAIAQAPEPSNEADGLIHLLMTLDNKAVSVEYSPDLSGSDPSHQQLLSGVPGSTVRVGVLAGHRALRIGSLATDPEAPPSPPREEGDPAPVPPTHELWLIRNTDGWELEAHRSDNGTINRIPLSHQESSSTNTQTFSAALRATGAEEGRLELRWGQHTWDTEFRFDELPPPPRRPRTTRPSVNEFDSDTSGFARRVTLNERNENAVVLPDGNQISMLYWKGINVEDEDYGRFADTNNGAVVSLIHAPPLRIRSDVGLRFGSTDIPTGNLAPAFAGSYAIWIRKTNSGWRFVFNNEPDAWGTQYDADFDAAEFEVHYERTTGSFRPLGVSVIPTSDNAGRLIVHWGPHEWAAPFTVIQ